MEIRIRSWCCKLQTFVVIVGIIQTLLYFLLALGIILWYILQNSRDDEEENIVEVSNLSELFPQEDNTSIILLASGLVLSFLGVLTSLFLIVGVKTRQRWLLLPWLILHFCVITLILVSGLYLIINYTILLQEKDYLKAAFSLFLIVFGILFIYIWILVDQMFIRQKFEKSLVSTSTDRWPSSPSVTNHVAPWYPDTGTLKSVKSLASVHSVRSARSVNQQREAYKHLRVQEFSMNMALPKLANQKRMSRSLEHILESSSNNSSNANDYKSLPRPSNRKFRESRGISSYNNAGFSSDTLRSSRSVASVKSVTIDPQVREYRYKKSGRSGGVGAERMGGSMQVLDGVPPPYYDAIPPYVAGFSDEGVTEFRSSPEDRGRRRGASKTGAAEEEEVSSIPSPVYPRRSVSQERKLSRDVFKPRVMTRDEIINKFCDGDVAL